MSSMNTIMMITIFQTQLHTISNIIHICAESQIKIKFSEIITENVSYITYCSDETSTEK